MPRLHQNTTTCIPDEQLVSGRTHDAGYKLLARDTCKLYLRDIYYSLICHGRLVSLCIQQQTGDKLATILSPILDTMSTATSGYKWIELVSSNMCPGVNAALNSQQLLCDSFCKTVERVVRGSHFRDPTRPIEVWTRSDPTQ